MIDRRSHERALLLTQCSALSWRPGDELFRLAEAVLPAPVHGVFFLDRDGAVIFKNLVGCVDTEIDLPPARLASVLVANAFEVDVSLDTASEGAVAMRFYAAAPIRLAGAILGAFFIMDRAPRTSFGVFEKSGLLIMADAVAKELRFKRLQLCGQAMDPQLAVTALLSPLLQPLADLHASSTEAESAIGISTEALLKFSGSKEVLDEEQTRMYQVWRQLRELNTLAEGMALLLGRRPFALDGLSLSNYPSALTIISHLEKVTPMLVSQERVEWKIDPSLSSTKIRSVEAVYSALAMLIVPLAVLSTSLQIGAKFARLESICSESEDIVEFGVLQLKILSWLPSSVDGHGADAMLPIESNVSAALSEIGSDCVSSLQRNYDPSTGSRLYTFSVLCSRKGVDERPLSFSHDRSVSPLPSVSKKGPEKEDSKGRRKLDVLVVDDSPMIVKMLTRMLNKLDCGVFSAENGAIAVKMVQDRFEETKNSTTGLKMFDVIFMDFLMPVMDGLEAMKAIQSWQLESEEICIACSNTLLIGLSATANAAEQLEGLKYGMHHFVPKPINTGVLSKLCNWKVSGLPLDEIVNNMKEEQK